VSPTSGTVTFHRTERRDGAEVTPAEQILTDWPIEEGEVLSIAKRSLLDCL